MCIVYIYYIYVNTHIFICMFCILKSQVHWYIFFFFCSEFCHTLKWKGLGFTCLPHSSTLAWRIPWTEEPGRLQSMGSRRVRHDWATSISLFTFHFHALEKEMATHYSILAWRIPGTEEPGGLPSMGLHRVRHNWSNLAAAATQESLTWEKRISRRELRWNNWKWRCVYNTELGRRRNTASFSRKMKTIW